MRNWEHNDRISEEVGDWEYSMISVDHQRGFSVFGFLNCLSSCVEVAVGEIQRINLGGCEETHLFPVLAKLCEILQIHITFPTES
jgi:hypothetical protein